MCIYEMSAFPDIFWCGNGKKYEKNMSVSRHCPVGRILLTLSAVGDMSPTCRRHFQLSLKLVLACPMCHSHIFVAGRHTGVRSRADSIPSMLQVPWLEVERGGVEPCPWDGDPWNDVIVAGGSWS